MRLHRLLLLALVLALPLLLAQCAGKQSPDSMRKELMKRETALAAADAEWEKKRAKAAKAGQENMPLDRLEAMGEMSLQSKDYETSLINFMEILRQNPTRHDIRYKVGVVFLLTGQMEEARQQFALVLMQRPEMLEAHEALGMVHLEEKKYPLAIEEFQQVLNQDSNRIKARHLLGIAYLEAGQHQRAITELQRVLRQEPGNITSLTTLGQAYLQKKDYNRALVPLKKAQALAPQDLKVNRHLGMALAGLKRYPEALEAFLKSGDEAQAYNNLGVYYFKDGQYEEAAKCFQKALDLRTTFYPEAKANLQRALEKLQLAQKDL
ncbi:MAG: tetratricopeptide repeat protein [Deltaproteobacteria bacterium]|nr:tetratricopeptide repeat protein [Deltaproteobacteria bacterium]